MQPPFMYLSGSKWNTRKRRPRRSNPWRVAALLLLIAGVIYVERFVLPQTTPLFVPTVEPTRSPASFILEAETLFQAGQLQQAIEAYQEAIEIDPQASDFYADLARTQVYAGDYQGAVTNAQNAVLLDSQSAYANAVLGWSLDFLAQEDPEAATTLDALSNLEEAVKLNPDSALVRAFYAEVIIDDNVANFEAAREQAETAVRLDPNLLEAQRALGYVWERTGNYDLAFEAYNSALRINDKLALLHIAIGNMHFNLGDAAAARESYIRASTLAPEDVIPLRLIAQAYAREGEFGKASQYAQSAVELEPSNARLLGDLGRMYYKNGDFESAISSLALAIHGGTTDDGVSVEGQPLDPGDALVVDMYSMYGLALARQSQCGLAVELAEALVTGVPESELAAGNAEEILILCGELEPPEEAEA